MSERERSEDVWKRLVTWFEDHYPAFLEGLNPPCDSAALTRVAGLVGYPIPTSLAALYAVHDGQQQLDDGLLLGWRFLPLEEVATSWAELAELERKIGGQGEVPFWKDEWLPFAQNLAGDFYCVAGVYGEVVQVLHDSSELRAIASSALDLFEYVADQLDAGGWEYSEADGFAKIQPG